MNAKKFINPDEDAVREAGDYIFEGSRIILAKCAEDTGGAKMTHGDRVIADALCCLAAQDQSAAMVDFEKGIIGTAAWFKKEEEEEKQKNAHKVKLWLDFRN